MKLLALTPSLKLGGAERSLVKLCNSISEDIDQIIIISFGAADIELLNEINPTIKTKILGFRSTRSFLFWIYFLIFLIKIRPNIILGWSTHANFMACLASIFFPRSRLIVSERNYLPNMYGKRFCPELRRRVTLGVMKVLYRRADLITANSELSLKALRRFMSVSRAYTVLPNCIDIDLATRKATEPRLGTHTSQGPNLLALGRLDFQKGFDVLLEALAIVMDKQPYWHLTLVGGGAEERALRSRCTALGLDNHVQFLGSHSNPFPYYKWADIVVVPSRYEGFPNVPLEAMSQGCAVICSDCRSGPRELTTAGKYGVLVPPCDHESLAKAILDLGSKDDERLMLGELAQEHIRNTYDIRVVRESYLAAIKG